MKNIESFPRPLGLSTILVTLLIQLLLIGTAAGADKETDAAADNGKQPDILFLMAEDLSARVGAFGDPVARTPNLDRLAASGVRFPNTFTAAGVCAPSRAAFITGVHQISLGGQHMRTSTSPIANYLAVPPPEVKAFPELLRKAGYYTFTDRKLDYQFSGIGAGSGPSSIWDSEGSTDPLAQLPPDQPFFGLLNFFITHESAAFLPEAVTGTPGVIAAERAQAARAGLAERTDPTRVALPPYYPDQPAVRAHIADLYDNVQLMDTQVGEILARLEASGRLADTIVIWTTDHGDPLPRAKRELYDSGIQVPMIIRWPESRRPGAQQVGAVNERLISFVDLAPTVLAMAGILPPAFLQGRNFLDPDQPPRRYIYASRDRIDEQQDRVRAVRDQRYKYLRFYQPGSPGAVHLEYRDQGRIMQTLWTELAAGRLNDVQSQWFQPRPEEALFDLSSDPHEVINLADDPAHLAVLSRMRSAFAAWRLAVPDLSDMPETELAERFWPDGVQPTTPAPEIERLADGQIRLRSEEGASIEQQIDGGPWRLHTEPVALSAGSVLRARASRYGHARSNEVSVSGSASP